MANEMKNHLQLHSNGISGSAAAAASAMVTYHFHGLAGWPVGLLLGWFADQMASLGFIVVNLSVGRCVQLPENKIQSVQNVKEYFRIRKALCAPNRIENPQTHAHRHRNGIVWSGL